MSLFSPGDFKPDQLVIDAAAGRLPGRALDLACGTGRNALWLAEQGWKVTAVDINVAAIESLNAEARRHGLAIETKVSDLEKDRFAIGPESWDLILTCRYFQRNLLEPARIGLRSGGLIAAIALLEAPGKTSPFRVLRGELKTHFADWKVLQAYEESGAGSHLLAGILAEKP